MNVAARRDLRLRALVLTLALIGGVGGLLWYLPGEHGTPVGNGFDVTRHMQAQRVATRFREAVNLLHTRHYREAVVAWEDVIDLAPTLPEARVNLGYAHLGLGDAAKAEQAFRAALALRESQANAHYGLALALAAQGRRDAARAAMRRFLHYTGPQDPYLARAHELLKRWQQAD